MKVVFLNNNNISFQSNDLSGFVFKPKKKISSLNIISKDMINYILLKRIDRDINKIKRTIELIIKCDVAIESDCDIMINEIKKIIDKLINRYLVYFDEFDFFGVVKELYLLYHVIDLKKKIIRGKNG